MTIDPETQSKHPPVRWLIRGVWCVMLVMLLGVLTGCQEHVVYDSMADLRALADGKGHEKTQGGISHQANRPHRHNTWAVQVKLLAGSNRSAIAQSLIKKLKNDGFDNVWVYENSGLMRILIGQFQSPQSDKAKQALSATHTLTGSDGKMRFPNAQIIGLTTADKLIHDPNNLRAYHNDYTLQIGYYIGPDRRENAEKAITELRKEGIAAFYYHGPHRSLITVGLFTKQQAFVSRRDPISPQDSETYVQSYSESVVNLQKRFPYNLENGITINEIINGKNAGTRPSFLVKTPG